MFHGQYEEQKERNGETESEEEREIRAKRGEWYLMQVVPYRSSDNTIDGMVLTFTDITESVTASLVSRV